MAASFPAIRIIDVTFYRDADGRPEEGRIIARTDPGDELVTEVDWGEGPGYSAAYSEMIARVRAIYGTFLIVERTQDGKPFTTWG